MCDVTEMFRGHAQTLRLCHVRDTGREFPAEELQRLYGLGARKAKNMLGSLQKALPLEKILALPDEWWRDEFGYDHGWIQSGGKRP